MVQPDPVVAGRVFEFVDRRRHHDGEHIDAADHHQLRQLAAQAHRLAAESVVEGRVRPDVFRLGAPVCLLDGTDIIQV